MGVAFCCVDLVETWQTVRTTEGALLFFKAIPPCSGLGTPPPPTHGSPNPAHRGRTGERGPQARPGPWACGTVAEALSAASHGVGGGRHGHIPAWKVRGLGCGFAFVRCHIQGLLRRELFNFEFIKTSQMSLGTGFSSCTNCGNSMGVCVSLHETKITGSGLKMKKRPPATQREGGGRVDPVVGAAGAKGRGCCSGERTRGICRPGKLSRLAGVQGNRACFYQQHVDRQQRKKKLLIGFWFITEITP